MSDASRIMAALCAMKAKELQWEPNKSLWDRFGGMLPAGHVAHRVGHGGGRKL